MSHAYATTSALTGLASSAFTWSGTGVNSSRLNDGLMDALATSSASAQASGQTLKVDLTGATALVGWALLNHNLASGACTVLIEAGTDGVTYGTVAKAATTIVTTAPNQKDSVLQFPSASFRYWRLTFVHTGTKVVSIGELQALTTVTTLTRKQVWGHGENERYVTNRNESRTGQVRATFLGGPIRTKTFSFKDLQATTQRDELMTMWRATLGGVNNLLWIETVDSSASAGSAASQECIWGKLAETRSWTEDDFDLYNMDGFELVGLGREVGS
jgi:hypothetical protein